jgi:transposase
MDINQNTSNSQVKFAQEEIKELATIRQGYEEITLALGQLELQKREVKKNETRINDRLTAAEASEKAFLDKIVAKYGEGTFDIATGVFTPKKTA